MARRDLARGPPQASRVPPHEATTFERDVTATLQLAGEDRSYSVGPGFVTFSSHGGNVTATFSWSATSPLAENLTFRLAERPPNQDLMPLGNLSGTSPLSWTFETGEAKYDLSFTGTFPGQAVKQVVHMKVTGFIEP